MEASVFLRFDSVITIICDNNDAMYQAKELKITGDKGECIIGSDDFEIPDNRPFFGEPIKMRIFIRDNCGIEESIGNILDVTRIK